MRLLSPTLVLGSVLAVTVVASGQQTASKSVRLEDLTWVDAEPRLGPDAVVVIPLGAAAREHGPHLKLRNDAILAEHLTKRVTVDRGVPLHYQAHGQRHDPAHFAEATWMAWHH